jgi:hypothetical protein
MICSSFKAFQGEFIFSTIAEVSHYHSYFIGIPPEAERAWMTGWDLTAA